MKMTWRPFTRASLPWVVGTGLLLILATQTRNSIVSPPLASTCVLPDDAERGRAWASTCKGCHDISPIEKDLRHSSGGSNLQHVYMSFAGTQYAPQNPTAAYQYPYPPLAAARDAGVVWNDENLFSYLRNQKEFLDSRSGKSFNVSTFYMGFPISHETDRRDIIAYLKAIKDHPDCD